MKIIKLNYPDIKTNSKVKVEWHLGLFCNNNCSYCSDTSHNDIPEYLSFENFKTGINNLTKNIKSERLSIEFTGGEPTINKKFLKMLEYANSKNIGNLSFTSNGWKNIEYYKKCISLVNSITFSYHMEYDNFDTDMIIEIQKHIKDLEKKQIRVHIMFLPGTLDKVKELSETFNKYNIRYAIRRIRPSYLKEHPDNTYWPDGRLKKGKIVKPFDLKSISTLLIDENGQTDHSEDNQRYYSDEELEYLENLPETNFKNLLIHYENGTTEESNINYITQNKLNQFKGWTCYAGVESLRVGEDGELTIGKCFQKPLGNIFGEFKLPTKPTKCITDWCCSATNINTTKYKGNK